MEPILATVNINIGLGKHNPSLVIRPGDDVAQLVNQLIEHYSLPKKVYSIIMERVAQELPTPPPPPPKAKEPLQKASKADKSRSVSPIRNNGTLTPKADPHRVPANLKENNRNISNFATETQKQLAKKSVSPVRKVANPPLLKKIDLKPNRTPRKTEPPTPKPTVQAAKPLKVDWNVKIQKLFRHLTKTNPPHIKILSPEYINLKGMDKGLLSELQEFFECLEEQ